MTSLKRRSTRLTKAREIDYYDSSTEEPASLHTIEMNPAQLSEEAQLQTLFPNLKTDTQLVAFAHYESALGNSPLDCAKNQAWYAHLGTFRAASRGRILNQIRFYQTVGALPKDVFAEGSRLNETALIDAYGLVKNWACVVLNGELSALLARYEIDLGEMLTCGSGADILSGFLEAYKKRAGKRRWDEGLVGELKVNLAVFMDGKRGKSSVAVEEGEALALDDTNVVDRKTLLSPTLSAIGPISELEDELIEISDDELNELSDPSVITMYSKNKEVPTMGNIRTQKRPRSRQIENISLDTDSEDDEPLAKRHSSGPAKLHRTAPTHPDPTPLKMLLQQIANEVPAPSIPITTSQVKMPTVYTTEIITTTPIAAKVELPEVITTTPPARLPEAIPTPPPTKTENSFQKLTRIKNAVTTTLASKTLAEQTLHSAEEVLSILSSDDYDSNSPLGEETLKQTASLLQRNWTKLSTADIEKTATRLRELADEMVSVLGEAVKERDLAETEMEEKTARWEEAERQLARVDEFFGQF